MKTLRSMTRLHGWIALVVCTSCNAIFGIHDPQHDLGNRADAGGDVDGQACAASPCKGSGGASNGGGTGGTGGTSNSGGTSAASNSGGTGGSSEGGLQKGGSSGIANPGGGAGGFDASTGGSDAGIDAGSGGTVGSGGTLNSGGTHDTGGTAGSGGTLSTGGGVGSGGTVSSGGTSNSGGTVGSGGKGGGGPVACSPPCSGSTPVCVQGTCTVPTSCPSLPAICGTSAASSCCDPVQVPGGSYFRAYDDVTAMDNTNSATVSAFALDRFEVTVGRFRRFVAAGKGNQTSPPASGAGAVGSVNGWSTDYTSNLATDKAGLVAAVKCEAGFSTWTDTAGTNEAKPINCVTWYEAEAFCIWDGGRLPTEAEWNFVAAGGDQQRVYPWSIPATSQTISAADASYYVDDTKQCFGDGVNGCTGADLLVAGSKSGNSLWGHADLGGNVAEWVADYYSQTFPSPCVDCAEPTPATSRVLRGGGFATGASGLTASSRDENSPLARQSDIGFRCAYGH